MGCLSITFDDAALKAQLAELKGDISDALRPAAQAGSQVLYDEVQRNVAKIGKKTGNLSRSIYQAYSKDNSTEGRVHRYHISWNAVKAPHGHLIEFGHVQTHMTVIDKRTGKWVTLKSKPLPAPKVVGAHPFLRPAMAKYQAALDACEAEFFKRLKNFK